MNIETIGVILLMTFMAFGMGAGAVYGLLSHFENKRENAKFWEAYSKQARSSEE